MSSSSSSDGLSYPFNHIDDTSRHINSQVEQGQSYKGHLQLLFNEINCLPADISNYLSSCWTHWDGLVQDHHASYTDLANTLSGGSQVMGDSDNNVAKGFGD